MRHVRPKRKIVNKLVARKQAHSKNWLQPTMKTKWFLCAIFGLSAIPVTIFLANDAEASFSASYNSKFVSASYETMGNYLDASTIMTLATELGANLISANNFKTAKVFTSSLEANSMLNTITDVVFATNESNVPDSLKCNDLYDKHYTVLNGLLSTAYTEEQMNLAVRSFSSTTGEAEANNMKRNLADYCSIDETAMGLCTFSPDGTDAASQDYSFIAKNKTMDEISAIVAEDYVSNLAIPSRSIQTANCTTMDCLHLINSEREYASLSSGIYFSMLGQINSSKPLDYIPLRNYKNENLGIDAGGGANSEDSTANSSETPSEGVDGTTTDAKLKQAADVIMDNKNNSSADEN